MTPQKEKHHPRLLKFREQLQSRYFSQERMFEYFKKELNAEEVRQTETFLAESSPMRQDLEDMKHAAQFIQQLRDVRISEKMLARIAAQQPVSLDLAKRLEFAQWSLGFRRSLMFIAGALGVLLLLLMVPWDEIYRQISRNQSTQVVLVETPRAQSELDLSAYEKQEKPEFSDDESKPTESEKNPSAKPNPSTTAKTTAKNEVAKTTTPPVSQPAALVKPIPNPVKIEVDDSQSAAANATTGYLYRGRLTISNLPDSEPKITEKIIALGGRKAGEVALGWKKTPQSAYYHFTIPENKLNELTQFLALYGEPRIVKEKHPRVMTDGIIRLIIEIDETKR